MKRRSWSLQARVETMLKNGMETYAIHAELIPQGYQQSAITNALAAVRTQTRPIPRSKSRHHVYLPVGTRDFLDGAAVRLGVPRSVVIEHILVVLARDGAVNASQDLQNITEGGHERLF